MAAFNLHFRGDVSVAPVLPPVVLTFEGRLEVAKGAAVLVKAGGVLVERRVWIKRDGVLVDAGA